MRQNKSFIILASFLTAVIVISGIALTTARPEFDIENSAKPVYQLRIDTRVVESGGAFDTWSYVKNPSNTIERDDTGPLHNVEVQYLTMTLIPPNEEPYPYRFYPDGYVEDLITGESWHFPEYALRWAPTVHPGETSLVYYGGWGGLSPGVWQFIYELSVEYEGTPYELTNTFNINVREN